MMFEKCLRFCGKVFLLVMPYLCMIGSLMALAGCFMDPRIDPLSVGVGVAFGMTISFYFFVCVQHKKLFEKILKSDQEVSPDE